MVIEHTRLCPRCDYDLSGQIAAWHSECPLGGQCPECGLAFTWHEIFHPAFVIAPWSFEHAKGSPLSQARAYLRTISWLHRPRHLWTGVPMASAFNTSRAFFIGLGGLLIAHLAAISLYFVCLALHQYTSNLIFYASGRLVTSSFTNASARVAEPTFLDCLHTLAFKPRAWIFPYFDLPGRGPGTMPPQAAAMLLLFLIFMPLSLLCAPTTLRRHKVRPRHIFRVGLYSFWLMPICAVIVPALIVLGWWFGGVATLHAWGTYPPDGVWASLQQIVETQAAKLISVLIALIVWTWWWAALSRYLRLRQAWLVTITLGFVAALATLAISFLIPGLSDYVPAVLNELLPGRAPVP